MLIIRVSQARGNSHEPAMLCGCGLSLRFGEEALDEDGEGVGGALFGGDGEVRRGGAKTFGLKEEERGLYLPM